MWVQGVWLSGTMQGAAPLAPCVGVSLRSQPWHRRYIATVHMVRDSSSLKVRCCGVERSAAAGFSLVKVVRVGSTTV
jgi:hypothetical protein